MIDKSYYNNIPDFIIDFFKIIKNPFRLRLLEIFFENDSISFSRLESITMKPSGYIYSHIHKMELSNFIQNFVKKTEENRTYSFYKLTKIGKIFYRYYLILNSNQFLLIDFDKPLINSLANKFRFSILLYLNENNKASFSALRDITKKKNSVLNHHLHILERTHLIQNFLKKDVSSSNYSYYEITELGNDILSSTIEIYNLSIGKKEYLEYFLTDLSRNNIPSIEKYEKNISSNKENLNFSSYFASWALPNEPIIGWIKILDKNINKIVVSYSHLLRFNNIYNNYEYEENSGNNEISFNNIKKMAIDFFSMELMAEKPLSNSMVNPESISIKAYDINENLIEEKVIQVDIIKPIIEMKVNKTEITSKSGFFEIMIGIPLGYKLKLGDLKIKALNSKGEELKFVKEDISPLDYPNEIPPEIEPNNLISNIKFQESGPFYVKFMLSYSDVMDNEYNIESSELKILDTELHQNLLNLSYNFSKAAIAT